MTSPYATAAIEQIARVTTTAELEALGPIVTGALGAQISAGTAAEAIMTPIAALSTVSVTGSFPSILSFISSLQSDFLGPQAASLAKLVAGGALATADLAAVTAAIAEAEARIGS